MFELAAGRVDRPFRDRHADDPLTRFREKPPGYTLAMLAVTLKLSGFALGRQGDRHAR
jgi:hypothetical protein